MERNKSLREKAETGGWEGMEKNKTEKEKGRDSGGGGQ